LNRHTRTRSSPTDGILSWLDSGGLLLRFAGPRLAASDVSRLSEDPLMPVRLREGGRTVGGAMSWGEPKTLAPFPETSPFHGLRVSDEVAVTAQVLAQPDPDLAGRTIAALADGTPLVTRKAVGQGQVVLFHVTANAEWSTLPLSGLFVQMLERLAVSTRAAVPGAAELEGQVWAPEVVLNAYGQELEAGEMAGVEGAKLALATVSGPGPDLPPGLYTGADRRVALNAVTADMEFIPADWPTGTPVEGMDVVPEQALKGWVLSAALIALMVDVVASLWLSGRLSGLVRGAAAVVALTLLLLAPLDAWAQEAAPADDPLAL
jgi:hypothetical protein